MSTGFGKRAVIALVSAVAALAGCRDAEQHRPLAYSKGEYQGAPDTGLSEEARNELRLRARRQSYN